MRWGIPKKKGFHRHHIIPRHMGGDDSAENLVYLTPSEHAQAHLELYEKYGKAADAQAYIKLSKSSLSGWKQTPEHIAKRVAATDYSKVSAKLKGRKSPTLGLKLGRPSDETIAKIVKSNTGQKRSAEARLNMSKSHLGKASPKKLEWFCIHCRQRMTITGVNRHGLDKPKSVCFRTHENFIKTGELVVIGKRSRDKNVI